ncbi:MAG: hypothetical protein CMF59_10915 [Leptospiraceae bacterium]|nr:hypothetical protein [Leptospiraceae bacterium]
MRNRVHRGIAYCVPDLFSHPWQTTGIFYLTMVIENSKGKPDSISRNVAWSQMQSMPAWFLLCGEGS